MNEELAFKVMNGSCVNKNNYSIIYESIITEANYSDLVNIYSDSVEYYPTNENDLSSYYEASNFYGKKASISFIVNTCYKTCQNCTCYGNKYIHYCLTCSDNYPYFYNSTDDLSNCLEQCPDNYIPDENNICVLKNVKTLTTLIKLSTSFIQPSKILFITTILISENSIRYSSIPTTGIKNKKTQFEDESLITTISNVKESILKSYNSESIIKASLIKLHSTIPMIKTTIISLLPTTTISLYSNINNISKNDSYEYFYDLIYNSINSTDNKNMLDILRELLAKGEFNSLILNYIKEKHKDLIYEEKNIKYQITSTYNQENNVYDNISSIILGECETILKESNGIEPNETLLILKLDIFQEGFHIPIIEYDVYDLETRKQLNLSICNKTRIKVYIPVTIDENNLFQYNSSSEYYNNICFIYKTNNKVDKILNDRRNEYTNNNMSLCEKDCEFTEYDYDTKKVLCECYTKINIPLISQIKINKDKLLNNFKDIKRSINIEIIKCYKSVICINGLKNNIGNFTILSIILFYFISAIIFILKGYKNLINKIDEMINDDKNKKCQFIKDENINILNTQILNKKKKFKKKKARKKKAKKINNQNNPPRNKSKKYKKKIITNNNKVTKSGEISHKSNSLMELKKTKISINLVNNNLKTNIFFSNKNKKMGKNIKKNIQYHIMNDYEINNLSYNEALQIDKRTYIQYYFSLLRMRHLLIFTFYTSNDYNSKIIKISLFLFYFSLNHTINGLFFDDSTMHKIYEDKGFFNFNYQIPKIVYSTIISSTIYSFITFLSLSQENILGLKDKEKSTNKIKEEINILIIKFILFYIISILFLVLFWFYLTCFCGIYINTQIYLIKNTLISFGFSLVYPFIIYLLPGIIRIPSLNSKEKNKACIYKISKFMQLL